MLTATGLARAQLPGALPAGDPQWFLAASCLLLTGLLGASLAALLRLWQRRERDDRRLRALQSERRALEDLLDGRLWRSDADHRLTALEPAMQRNGVEPGERPPVWLQLAAGDGGELQAQFEARQPLICVRLERSACGSPALLRASRLSGADGSFAGYLGVLRDVQPADSAERSSADRDDGEHTAFSYTVSHDLRAPIRVVEGFTRILKEDYGGLLDRIGNDHLDRVLSAASRMNGMIDALLALSRLSSQPLARQPVDLSQLASFVAEDLRRQHPGRDVQLSIDPDMRVVGDPTLLRVVVENLLGNAWKYTARCETAVVRFARHASRPGTYTVSDNGAGFDMRHADRLFGMFQRLHGASEFEGTGVGLASVRRIVRRHGGEIWAEAAPGRGASFHFSLAAG